MAKKNTKMIGIKNPTYNMLLMEEIIMEAYSSASIIARTKNEVGFVIMGKDIFYINIQENNRLCIYPYEINLVDQNVDPVEWLRSKVNKIIFSRYRGMMKMSYHNSIQRLYDEQGRVLHEK